jgi:pimeloyl-ACP methyl ester carboxylesterase
VGHSMGGFVVQKFLEQHTVPAAVLMASAPPRGHLRSLLRSTRRRPWPTTKFAFTGRPWDLFSSTADARGFLFGANASDALVNSVTAQLQVDSSRAILFDMVVGDLVRTGTVTTPLLVIGGAQDQIYLPEDVRRTAAAYRTTATVFPDIGHELMLEPGWQDVADHIAFWLDRQGL